MKILHTSDWHIGSTFYGKKRYEEYNCFFQWLLDFIQENQIDVLLVSGDVFDTTLPTNTAQEQYYSLLVNLRNTPCKHVVITAGNHDSPSFLTAPKGLLKSFNVHVIGSMPQNEEEEIITINVKDEEITILAVPYLRERDLQGIDITEDYDTRADKIVQAIKKHYADLTQKALAIKNPQSPLLAMGHLYIAGASLEEEGERELYIGSLAQISANIFPKEIDYVALGHIHSAQQIAKTAHIRYCGSPLAMSFSERNSAKKMILLETDNKTSEKTGKETGNCLKIQEIPIPEFQITKKICGDLPALQEKITELKKFSSPVWLEVEYTGSNADLSIKDTLFDLAANSNIEILKFKNQSILNKYYHPEIKEKNLENLSENEIFQNILEKLEQDEKITQDKKEELLACYHEILTQLHEQDSNE